MDNSRINHTKKIFSIGNKELINNIISDKILNLFSPILTIDLTEKCNFKCGYCIDKRITFSQNKKEIDFKKIKDLLPEIKSKGCRAIEITGGGEPTLYSNFCEFVKCAKNLEFKLCLITNGSNLKNLSEKKLLSYFDWIRISLDASNSKTHMKVHNINVNYFDTIIDVIKNENLNIDFGISFLVNELNYSEIESACILSKNIGAKYFQVKPLFDSKYCDEIKNEVENQMKNIQSLSNNNFKVLINSKKKIFRDENMLSNDKCYTCLTRTLITPSGLYPCSYKRGNLEECSDYNSVDDIISIRNNYFDNINTHKCYKSCSRKEFNEIINELKNIYMKNYNIINYIFEQENCDDWLWL